jgi:hypothetical protein
MGRQNGPLPCPGSPRHTGPKRWTGAPDRLRAAPDLLPSASCCNVRTTRTMATSSFTCISFLARPNMPVNSSLHYQTRVLRHSVVWWGVGDAPRPKWPDHESAWRPAARPRCRSALQRRWRRWPFWRCVLCAMDARIAVSGSGLSFWCHRTRPLVSGSAALAILAFPPICRCGVRRCAWRCGWRRQESRKTASIWSMLESEGQ